MPTKKDLALLSEKAQPPLRRGRGLRLSRASKRAQDASLEAGDRPVTPGLAQSPPADPPGTAALVEAPPEPVAAASEPDAVAAELPEPPAASDAEPRKPRRKKRKLQLRKDLLRECKRIARSQDRKLYQVIESALEDYIRRHGVRE